MDPVTSIPHVGSDDPDPRREIVRIHLPHVTFRKIAQNESTQRYMRGNRIATLETRRVRRAEADRRAPRELFFFFLLDFS